MSSICDCDTTQIDSPFLEGAQAFLSWVMSKKHLDLPPDNPYAVDSGFEHSAWFVGFEDMEAVWLSWR